MRSYWSAGACESLWPQPSDPDAHLDFEQAVAQQEDEEGTVMGLPPEEDLGASAGPSADAITFVPGAPTHAVRGVDVQARAEQLPDLVHDEDWKRELWAQVEQEVTTLGFQMA